MPVQRVRPRLRLTNMNRVTKRALSHLGAAVCVVVLVAAACSTDSANRTGTVTGTFQPCGPAFARTLHLVVQAKHDGDLIRSHMFPVTAGGVGRYRFVLPPGTYTLGLTSGPTTTATVRAHETTQKDIPTLSCLSLRTVGVYP